MPGACFQKSGASVVAIRKYIIHKYPSLELERRGYLLKQALKRELNRGVIKQVLNGKRKRCFRKFCCGPEIEKTASEIQKQKGKKSVPICLSTNTVGATKQCLLSVPCALVRELRFYEGLERFQLRKALVLNIEAVEQKPVMMIIFDTTFQNRSSAVDPEPQVKLEDILPLAFTRLCEPKEASYSLIRKYVSQYYPKLRVDIR
ncbi:HP1BP3 [Cervus elaphus hippelaphus]|uniref:Heterochromatin protein 1-binding protein 3 n=1 Tax=Cervus elaphus hippelaphus TaxID=46360 RepID=A0A212D3K1_CEREH|nr:HP1BP3 [Cervus elaphus hippelaphus]